MTNASRSLRIGVRESDRFLEFLCGPEGDFLAGLDLDGLAGGGVAAHARGALPHLQDAEARDADVVPTNLDMTSRS